MTSPTNHDRAGWARNALIVFAAETFDGDHPDTMQGGDLECAIGDLICDLMHFADYCGFDVQAILDQGIAHYEFDLQFPED